MRVGRSNTVLITDLLSKDGPHTRVADEFLRATCSRCGQPLTLDPRYDEWGPYCTECTGELRSV